MSVTEQKKFMEFHAALCDILECPICLEVLDPEFRSCLNGHVICHGCCNKLTQMVCPVCRGSFSKRHIFQLKEYLKSFPRPCNNATKGCQKMIPKSEKNNHEKYCHFGTTKCFLCEWSGLYSDLKKHVMRCHPNELWDTNNITCTYKQNFQKLKHFKLVSTYNELFWYRCESKSDIKKLAASVIYIGNRPEATKFKYTIQLQDPTRSKNQILRDIEKNTAISPKYFCQIQSDTLYDSRVPNKTFVLPFSKIEQLPQPHTFSLIIKIIKQ